MSRNDVAPDDDRALAEALRRALGVDVAPDAARAVSGGSINACLRYDTTRGCVFVKHGPRSSLDMYSAEAAGLEELAKARAVRVPSVLGIGATQRSAFLALEWIDFGAPHRKAETLLGERLAHQHRRSQARFGWHRDNTIGSTPQPNQWGEDWIAFLRDRRLGFQLDLAERTGASKRLVDRGRLLCECLDRFYTDYRPQPALLHGDLWGGNWGADADGQPVIFDPAVYYGDREADLAMTRLFGGFGPAFYASYEATWPLDRGASVRTPLHTLYHVLNHYNLFGGGYAAQAQVIIDRLLAHAGR
jgi:protein-ribulosamine 3-kinase